MNEFIERLKTDRFLQIVVVILPLTVILLFFILLKPILFPPKKPQLPCYGQTITIWWPFDDDESRKFLADFEKFCVKFKIFSKTISQINEELVTAIAEGNYPNVVFIDNDSLPKLAKFLATPTPIAVDALVAYYNVDVLNFFDFKEPRTFDELKDFISKLRSKNYKTDFYPIGLGTKDVRHRREIITSLLLPNQSGQDLKENLSKAILTYLQFSDPNSEYFSYPLDAGDDLINFANDKLAIYLGFYSDRQEILKINPRLNYKIDFSPLNTFPPKFKIYSQTYYLAPIKKGNQEGILNFIAWFKKERSQSFLENFDYVPILENEKDSFLTDADNKKIVLKSYNSFGDTFQFVNKKVLFDNLDNLLENKNELSKNIEKISDELQRK